MSLQKRTGGAEFVEHLILIHGVDVALDEPVRNG
jgi:hypothetical protein